MSKHFAKGMQSVPNADTGVCASNVVKSNLGSSRGRPMANGLPSQFKQTAAKGGGSISKDAKASSDTRAQFYAKGKGPTGKKASLLD